MCVCVYWFMYLICYAALVVFVVIVALSEKTSVFIFIILDS